MGIAEHSSCFPPTTARAYAAAATAYGSRGHCRPQRDRPGAQQPRDPGHFNLRDYAPQFLLVNGAVSARREPRPSQSSTGTTGGLLRFVNGGVQPSLNEPRFGPAPAGAGDRREPLRIHVRGPQRPRMSQTVVAQTIAAGADVRTCLPRSPGRQPSVRPTRSTTPTCSSGTPTSHGFGGMLAFLEAGTVTGSGKPVTVPTRRSRPGEPNERGPPRDGDRQRFHLRHRALFSPPLSSSSTPPAPDGNGHADEHQRVRAACGIQVVRLDVRRRRSPVSRPGTTPSTSTPRTARAGAPSTSRSSTSTRPVRPAPEPRPLLQPDERRHRRRAHRDGDRQRRPAAAPLRPRQYTIDEARCPRRPWCRGVR